MSEDTNFIPASGNGWRYNDAGPVRHFKKRKGIAPTSFHISTSPSTIHSMKNMQQVLKECRSKVRCHDRIQSFNSLKARYQKFENETMYREFPLQELAMKAFDDMKAKFDQNKSQDDAFDGSESSLMWSLEPRIFAIEKSSTGKRKYIVCSMGRFNHHYWRHCEPHARHYYELIREGNPCRLYFDLEFNKEANPEINDDDCEFLMQDFISEIIAEINATFDISIDETGIVDLDSTTATKFSRHLIIHMPKGELFQDAIACGEFTKALVSRLAEEVATGRLRKRCPTLAKYLFVNSKPSVQCAQKISEKSKSGGGVIKICGNSGSSTALRNKTCFVDTGVYTRNRLFRLFGSSKYGKPASAALRIASTNKFPFPYGFGNGNIHAPAMEEALLSRKKSVTTSANSDDLFDILFSEGRYKHCGWDNHAKALESTLVTPGMLDNVQILKLKGFNVDDRKRYTRKCMAPHSSSCPYVNNPGDSPFPSLEKFVNSSLAKRKGINGSVRAWSVESTASNELDEGMVIYQIKGNRFCENVQRCHKSNNVMWNVSLRHMKYWQSCHDPECRMMSFRGEVKNLPEYIQQDIRMKLLEKSFHVDADFEAAMASLDIPAWKNTSNGRELMLFENHEKDEFGLALAEALSSNPEICP